MLFNQASDGNRTNSERKARERGAVCSRTPVLGTGCLAGDCTALFPFVPEGIMALVCKLQTLHFRPS